MIARSNLSKEKRNTLDCSKASSDPPASPFQPSQIAAVFFDHKISRLKNPLEVEDHSEYKFCQIKADFNHSGGAAWETDQDFSWP